MTAFEGETLIIIAYACLSLSTVDSWLCPGCVSQGFASVSQSVSQGSTLWGAHHLPQNRDVVMLAAGDGSVSLWKYQYPDQRKVKVGAHSRNVGVVCESMPTLPPSRLRHQPVATNSCTMTHSHQLTGNIAMLCSICCPPAACQVWYREYSGCNAGCAAICAGSCSCRPPACQVWYCEYSGCNAGCGAICAGSCCSSQSQACSVSCLCMVG